MAATNAGPRPRPASTSASCAPERAFRACAWCGSGNGAMRGLLVRFGQVALMLALASGGTRASAAAPDLSPDSLERAAGLIRAHAFGQADALLRRLLAAD